MSIKTNFGVSKLKKDNTWFTLKSCFCSQKAWQEAFQAHYSLGKLGGYKGLYCNHFLNDCAERRILQPGMR